MENDLIQVKTFGQLRPETLFSKDVSLSFDTLHYCDTSDIKVVVQIEPPEVMNVTQGIITNAHNYDLILAWNEDVLSNCLNSKRFIFGTCWIDFDNLCLDKKDEISFIMSNKNSASGHQLRHSIWQTYGHRDRILDFDFRRYKTPPRIDTKNVLFNNAKYHITVENTARTNWITEKVIDCFATKTIPIYYGAPNIGEFFNIDGIIQFNNMDELARMLSRLTPQFYTDRINIIEENYEKSKEYYNIYDRIENEINNLILEKYKNE